MSKAKVVTARIDEKSLADLERLATYHDRSKSWLVAKAVGQYVQEETQFFAFLQEGEDAIARGDYVTHEELVEEIEAMRAKRKTKRAA